MMFPVPYIPSENYLGGRGFGADRSAVAALLKIPGGQLKHGAVDLIVPPQTPVLAMEDGVVTKGPYGFFLNVSAIEIKHTSFIARYCEIHPTTEVRAGEPVKEGQVIGYVGNQPGADMLHLELFSGTATGGLTLDSKNTKNAPYYRRKDMIDPTPILDRLRFTVAQRAFRPLKYVKDADGKIFVAFPPEVIAANVLGNLARSLRNTVPF